MLYKFDFDENLPLAQRTRDAGNEAMGAWFRMGMFATTVCDDRLIPAKCVRVLCKSRTALKRLVSLGFLTKEDDGYRVIGFPDAHPTRAPGEKRVQARGGGAISEALRQQVLARDGWVCKLCGLAILAREQLHIDHVRPVYHGGKTELSNLQPAHALCNIRKGTRWTGEGVQ